MLWVAPPEYHDAATLLSTLVWGLVIAALLGKILHNLRIIFPNAPIPAMLTDKPRMESEAKP